MAVVLRRRTLVNPHRRKNRTRRLTLAQKLAGFGGKRVQAAARGRRKNSARSRRAKFAAIRKKVQVHSPRKRRMHRPRRNVSAIVTAGLPFMNPVRRRKKQAKKHMAKSKTHRRRRSTAHKTHRRRVRRSNPRHFARRHRRRNSVKTVVKYRYRAKARRHSRRHNPRGGAKGITSLLFNAAYVGVGGIGSRMLTQLALGPNNQGVMGYAGNALSTGLLGWGVGKFFGRSARNYVFIGGALGILLRLIQDNTPYGKALALSGMGDSGMGMFINQSFVAPPIYNSDGSVVVPPAFRPPAPQPAKGVGASTYGRGASTYA